VPVQTGPEAHPASCMVGTWSFRGVKQLGCGADHPSLSNTKFADGLKLYFCLSSVPAQACHGGYGVSPRGKVSRVWC
jgi:hypothetical protein